MKTLQDALFENSGVANLAVVDHDEMARQVAASQPAAQLVDRRSAASIAHELRNIESNFAATEEDRQLAAREVVNITGAIAKLTQIIADLRRLPGAAARSKIDGYEKKLESLQYNLNNPRTGAKLNLDRLTKIAASRKQILEDFLGAGTPTNREMLQEDRKLQKLMDEADRIDTTVSQPSVGVPMRTAGETSTIR